MKDKGFFKAVSYLTTLLKSEGSEFYVEQGFTEQAMAETVLSVLEQTMSTEQIKDKWTEYYERVYENIEPVIKDLLSSGLIIKEDNRYFVTDQGYDVADFMLNLSQSYFKDFNFFHIKDQPYRFYPGSSLQYGLN
jgi:predicted transcriptional regulator